MIVDGFSNIQSAFGFNCANIVKQVLCKGMIPQCSSNRTIATYGSFASACAGMSACPSSLINFNSMTGPQICADNGRQIQLTTCQKYNVGTLNTQFCGQLPSNITFPSWMIANLPSLSTSIGSLKSTLQRGQVSTDCTNKWIKLACVAPPFCSADRKKILSAVTKQQCETAINW